MTAEYGPEWSAGLRRADASDLAAWLGFALSCADVADELALRGLRQELTIEAKHDGSFVTEVDRAIETTLRARIAERFPDHGVVGEEYGAAPGSAPGSTRWYLDPIDGTHNFMRGIPLFGYLLAVEREGELQVGVMSAPAMGERWYAYRGGGAWHVGKDGERRIRTSRVAALEDAQLVYGSVRENVESGLFPGFEALLAEAWRDRGFGDFWGYALVADGSAEAMMERQLGPWDLAAPRVIVEEAGGALTDFDGNRSLTVGEGLGTNGILHREILGRLRRPG